MASKNRQTFDIFCIIRFYNSCRPKKSKYRNQKKENQKFYFKSCILWKENAKLLQFCIINFIILTLFQDLKNSKKEGCEDFIISVVLGFVDSKTKGNKKKKDEIYAVIFQLFQILWFKEKCNNFTITVLFQIL